MKRLVLCLSLFIIGAVLAEENIQRWQDARDYQHSFDTSPISPAIGIYGFHYNRRLSPNDELIFGLGYMNIQFDFGETHSPAIIFGYRRYLWRNLHIEYQIWPSYDWFYEKNDDKTYPSFDIWNEFRLGYQFDFVLWDNPFYFNIQWPFGFGLYDSNKPESFKDYQSKGDNRFFYQFPLPFLGYRF